MSMASNTPPANRRNGRTRLLDALQRPYERFLKIRGNPREIALGFALGLFVGMTPFMGFHMAIAVPLAALLKWNKFSSALAVWITNPLSAPFIYTATYFVGAKLTAFSNYLNIPQIDHKGLMTVLYKAPEVLMVMVVGGVVLGLPLAVAGYYLSYAAIIKYRKSLKYKLALKKARLAEKKKKIKGRLRHG
jgi:uncharacterized protein (DUF2062 family)